mmetsp:Transcript_41524/g.112106  ORF Transcript_41524/g.112106 Transcript_41524/m.112106 type:complete len:206 (-) Transcript_41524:395-1012(-)
MLIHVDAEELVWARGCPRSLRRTPTATSLRHEVQAPADVVVQAPREADASLLVPLGVRAEPSLQVVTHGGVPRSVAVVGLSVPGVATKVCEDGVCPPSSGKRSQLRVLRAAQDSSPPNLLDLEATYELVVPEHAVTVLNRHSQIVDEHGNEGLLHIEVPILSGVYVSEVLVTRRDGDALEGRSGEHTAQLPLHHGGVGNLFVVEN